MDDFALADAERYGDTLMAENDPTVAVFQGNRRRMKRAIDEVRTGMPNCCPDVFTRRREELRWTGLAIRPTPGPSVFTREAKTDRGRAVSSRTANRNKPATRGARTGATWDEVRAHIPS